MPEGDGVHGMHQARPACLAKAPGSLQGPTPYTQQECSAMYHVAPTCTGGAYA